MSRYVTLDFVLSSGADDWFAPGFGERIHRDSLRKFYSRIRNETDRGLVIVSHALLDDLVDQRLRANFSRGNSEARDRLFGAFGPFSSFASKTDALFCLGSIGAKTRNNLHIIRKLRNHCAHKWEEFRFDEATDRDFLKKLSVPDFGIPSNLPLHPKSKFSAAVFISVLSLNIFALDSSGPPSESPQQTH